MTINIKQVDTNTGNPTPFFLIRILRDRSGAIGLFLVLAFTCTSLLGLIDVTPLSSFRATSD